MDEMLDSASARARLLIRTSRRIQISCLLVGVLALVVLFVVPAIWHIPIETSMRNIIAVLVVAIEAINIGYFETVVYRRKKELAQSARQSIQPHG